MPEEEMQIVMKEGDIVKKKDFLSAFEKVLKVVLDIKNQTKRAIDSLEQTYSALMTKMDKRHEAEMSAMREKADKERENVIEMTMKKLESKIAGIKDGKDADEEKIVSKVLEQIKLPEQKEIILDTPEQLRDKLENLKGNERLRMSAIDGLEEKLNEVSEKAGKSSGYVPGGAKGRIHYYDLTSLCDGVTKTFTIPFNFGVIGVYSTQSPIIFRPVVDWTAVNKTLTLTSAVSAPSTSQTLWIMYVR